MKGIVGYWVFRALFGFLGLLPESVIRRLGLGIGYLMSFVARRRFTMTERHQRRVLGPDADVRKAARRVFALYGRYWAETFWIRPRRHEDALRRSTLGGLEHLHRAVASGRGVILALGHTGNWEIAGLRAATEGARVLAVAETLSNPRIVEWWVQMREMMDIDVVLTGKGIRATGDLIRRLESGGTIALLSDRDLKGTGIPVTLFGEETTLPAGPLSLACRTGAVLLPTGTYFMPGAGHHFEVYPPLDIPQEGELEERVREGTLRFARVLEQIIRKHPQQWHLIIPNWPSDQDYW